MPRSFHVALIGPNRSYREEIRNLLGQSRFKWAQAEDEDEFGWSSENVPELALLCLGDLPPKEIARLLNRVSSKLNGIPWIALTQSHDVGTTRRAFLAGARDCVEAPITPAHLERSIQRLHRSFHAPSRLVVHDPLTGLPWSRVFLDAFDSLSRRRRQEGPPFSIAILDVAGFHHFNERVSSVLGDRVLRHVAGILQTICPGELVTRHQADQFLFVLRDADEEQTRQVALRIQSTLARTPLRHDHARHVVTIYGGIAMREPSDSLSAHQLIRRASWALAHVKRRLDQFFLKWSELNYAPSAPFPLKAPLIQEVEFWAERLGEHLRDVREESVRALVAAVKAKDPFTRDHSWKVAQYAEQIARRLHVPEKPRATLRKAAMLHDIGKIGVPDAILLKPGPLSEDEYAVIKQHPMMGCEILGHVNAFHDEIPLIRHHHERFDGQGYPHGLVGKDIPFGARILMVADTIDAMLSRRAYKSPFTPDHVMGELVKERGRQFDPAVAQTAVQWMRTTFKTIPLPETPHETTGETPVPHLDDPTSPFHDDGL